MLSAYEALHEAGHAHSVETWVDGALAGGLYGVALGRVFFGESMFACLPDASKIALAHLARQLDRWNYGLIDCQMSTAHLARLGAREVPRRRFVPKVQELVNYPQTAAKWRLDHDLFE
jgi:leucyl/phenylalanyl-tRNA--protein transferase